MTNHKIMPGNKLPEIILPLLSGGEASIDRTENPDNWKLIVIFRGAHCPLCANYLKTLQSLKDSFLEDGVEILAISADSKTKADGFARKHQLSFPIAYDLSLQQMQMLGLYISDPVSESEADHPFPEPGLFVLTADGRVQIVTTSNAPFVRPDLKALQGSLRYVRTPGDERHDPFGGNNYPIRGTHVDAGD